MRGKHFEGNKDSRHTCNTTSMCKGLIVWEGGRKRKSKASAKGEHARRSDTDTVIKIAEELL